VEEAQTTLGGREFKQVEVAVKRGAPNIKGVRGVRGQGQGKAHRKKHLNHSPEA